MNTRTKIYITLPIEYLVFAAGLFIPAGTFKWAEGWVFLATFVISATVFVLWLLKHSPGVIDERMKVYGPGQKTWDKVFVLLIMALFLVWLVIMPLDAVRFHWSRMPLFLEAAGFVIMLATFYPFYLVFRDNPFASSAVRVQAERGQTVVSAGLYARVRHPMYAAAVIFMAAVPLLLGSWCGVFAGLLFVPLLGVRAVLEERYLKDNLKGYDEYMALVKYRFFPGIW